MQNCIKKISKSIGVDRGVLCDKSESANNGKQKPLNKIHLKQETMKKLSFYSIATLLIGVMFFTACENNFNNGPEVTDSILPDQLTVEIPSALSADVSMYKSAVAVGGKDVIYIH